MIDVVSLALSKNYTDKEITKAATSLSFKQKIVESLPSSGEIHTIYFIKNNSSWKDNYYDEYLWIPDTNNFEKIGSTEIPAALPNPNALTFTGAVEGTYNGSNPLTVEIPVGADGKSAYQYAKEGGYTGTEAEFAQKLAQEMLSGTTDELTPTQVYDAVSAGIPVKVQYVDNTFGVLSYTNFSIAESMNAIGANTISYFNDVYILGELLGNTSNNEWFFMSTILAQKTDIPSRLPNPNALTFTGAVTGTYDGSTSLRINIPSAVTDAHINELINTALNAIGVAEEGAY